MPHQLLIQKELNGLCFTANAKQLQDFLMVHSPINFEEEGKYALVLAIRSVEKIPRPTPENCLRTVQLLVEAGANIHANEDSPIFWALTGNNHVVVNYLLNIDNHFNLNKETVDDYLSLNPSVDPKIQETLRQFCLESGPCL